MLYINRIGQGQRETVDQFATRKEAYAMRREYETSDRTATYKVSRRPCLDWLEQHTTNRHISQIQQRKT